jgi:hypothetical protein
MKITIDGREYRMIEGNVVENNHNTYPLVSIEGLFEKSEPKGKPKFDVIEIMATTRDNDGYCSRVEVQFESDKHDPTPYMAEIKAKIKAVIESYTV